MSRPFCASPSLSIVAIAGSLVLAWSTLSACDSPDDPDATPAGADTSCITDISASDRHRFECEGLTFHVSVPEQCLTQACGLIFDVPGFTMTGKKEDKNTQLASLGREYGYIVVNPDPPRRPILRTWGEGEDDPKVYRIMQQVMAAFGVDEKRIHITGFSQGGSVTWRSICDYSHIVASAAPAAKGLEKAGVRGCFTTRAPEHVVPILYLHGTNDALIDFSDAIKARDAVISTHRLDQEEVLSTDHAHTWTRYSNLDGAIFEFIQHDYRGASFIRKGHCFPGSVSGFGCKPPNAFNWGAEVMKFFLAHPKP